VIDKKQPLTFAALAPLAADSRVARIVARGLDVLARATSDARIAAFVTRLSRSPGDEPGAAIGFGAWVIAVAALTHIAMLMVVERYHFPSRAALVLPAIVTVAAIVTMLLRRQIARAMTDRRQQ
jgi:hypothetical protein